MPPSIAANSSPHKNSQDAAPASRANATGSAIGPRLKMRSEGTPKVVTLLTVTTVSSTSSGRHVGSPAAARRVTAGPAVNRDLDGGPHGVGATGVLARPRRNGRYPLAVRDGE